MVAPLVTFLMLSIGRQCRTEAWTVYATLQWPRRLGPLAIEGHAAFHGIFRNQNSVVQSSGTPKLIPSVWNTGRKVLARDSPLDIVYGHVQTRKRW